MAQLIEALAITGSRKSDGSANASGRLWAYVPGTTSPRTLYADAAASTPLTQPVALNAAGKAVAYLTSSADLRIETSTGATLDSFTYGARDGLVEVVSDAFTGTLPSGSQGAGGSTDLPTALLALGMSLGTGNGGVDGKFHGRYGTVSTNVWEELESIWLNVKRFGAVGDGVHDDTTNIQAALNAAAAAGGGVVYFPIGTFIVSSTLVIPGSGVTVAGAGRNASFIKSTSAVGDAVSVSGINGITFSEIAISNSSTSTGSGINITGTCIDLAFSRVSVSGHRTGIKQTSGILAQASLTLRETNITTDVNAAAVCLSLFVAQGVLILGGRFSTGGSGQGIGVSAGGSSSVIAFGGYYSCLSAFSTSGSTLAIFGSTGNSANTYSITAGTPDVYNFASKAGSSSITAVARGYNVNLDQGAWGAAGALNSTTINTTTSYTPDVTSYQYHRINATGAGTTITINSPTGLFAGGVFTIVFANNSGGAVTWAFNGVYRVLAVAPATGNQVAVTFMVQAGAVNPVEISRGSTTAI